jgi:hypothetical protein
LVGLLLGYSVEQMSGQSLGQFFFKCLVPLVEGFFVGWLFTWLIGSLVDCFLVIGWLIC